MKEHIYIYIYKRSYRNVEMARTKSVKSRNNARSSTQQQDNYDVSELEQDDEASLLYMPPMNVPVSRSSKTQGRSGLASQESRSYSSRITNANGKGKKVARKEAVKVSKSKSAAEILDDISDIEEDDGFVFSRKAAPAVVEDSSKRKSRIDKHPGKRKNEINGEEAQSIEGSNGREPSRGKSAKTNSKPRTGPGKAFPVEAETPFPAKRLKSINIYDHESLTPQGSRIQNIAIPSSIQRMTLPVSDTPVMRRNQKMRQQSGVRRSSYGNRGKRISSTGNGYVAVPHEDVRVQDFYRHLDSSLPEPQRMKQILLWCCKRVLQSQGEEIRRIRENARNSSSTEEMAALSIARVFKEEIVRDLTDGKISTNWWNRPEDGGEGSASGYIATGIKRPNAQNIANEENIKVFETRLEELEKEKQAWMKQLENIQSESYDFKANITVQQQLTKEQSSEEALRQLEANNELYSKVESQIDKLYDSAHKLFSIAEYSKQVRTDNMARIARVLSARKIQSPPAESSSSSNPSETRRLEDTSLRDLLRSISRVG